MKFLPKVKNYAVIFSKFLLLMPDTHDLSPIFYIFSYIYQDSLTLILAVSSDLNFVQAIYYFYRTTIY